MTQREQEIRDRLESQLLEDDMGLPTVRASDIRYLLDELTKRDALIAELRAALQPFADEFAVGGKPFMMNPWNKDLERAYNAIKEMER